MNIKGLRFYDATPFFVWQPFYDRRRNRVLDMRPLKNGFAAAQNLFR
jgi:hypothetical protein